MSEPDSQGAERRSRSAAARVGRIVAISGIAAFSVATVAGFLGALGLVGEVLTSFRFQYAWLLLVLALAALVIRCFKAAVIAAIAAAVNVALIAGLYLPPPTTTTDNQDTPSQLSIVQFNAQSALPDSGFESFIEFVAQTRPDVVAVEDLAPAWADRFRREFSELSPVIELPNRGGGGIGLYSRIPIKDARLRYFSDAEPGLASITARIPMGRQVVDLIVTHPSAPMSPSTYRARDDQLANIASERGRFASNLIVIGDLNMTSWSPSFSSFTKAMELQDTRKGFGVQATWPALLPGALAPIDHCLVSDTLVTNDRRVGPRAGSQHLPVYVRLSLT